MTSQTLKDAARRFGADLVGIASTESLRDLPADENPLSIFPQAKAVVVIARKVLRGALRGVEQGTEFDNAFPTFGFMALEDNLLAKTTYDVTIWAEAQGFEAVPLFAYDCAGQPVGVPVAPGKPAPNVMLKYRILAQAAGLGETGLHGLFLTPEFGPRQRFALLLTDAELEADAPFQPRLCDDCGACVAACPLDALDAGVSAPFGFAGHGRPVAARDNARCLRCRNGAVQTNEGRFNTVERMAAACSRACVAALEARGATAEQFAQPFRQSTPWARDTLGNVVS
jgi:epoxyqueuosine reductase QueG